MAGCQTIPIFKNKGDDIKDIEKCKAEIYQALR
jgi:hypothetical protein